MFLVSTRAVGAAKAWTLLIKVFLNSWKRSLFGATIRGAGAGVGGGNRPGAGASELKTRDPMVSFP